MSEQVKLIIQELNKPPFDKGYNLISFDQLEPIALLQVLNDILGHIDPRHLLDIREESPDGTAVRICSILRVLKYKPSTENMGVFRLGLVQADKPVIYPIMEWLLSRKEELKKRAYLAKFLVKVDIPPDIMQDDQVNDLYAQYEELINQFTELHKQYEGLKSTGLNTTEIRKDISNMEEEKDQLMKRIERLKRKVEAHPNSHSMMTVAKNLRKERDRETKLATQRLEQKNQIQHCEQRVQRLQQQLRDIRQASVGATPEGLLQRLEEETRANGYIVKEKLPKEIDSKKKTIQELQRVVIEPAMGQSDLDALRDKIVQINTEIGQLIEKRMRSNDPMDDKLSLFRQQAAIIGHKKEAAAVALREAREEHNRFLQEAEEKRDLVQDTDGGEVLKGEDFKRYVNKLRSKSTVYKKKRQELSEFKAEGGVLSRTEEILKQQDNVINQQLGLLEKKKGVTGYRETQEEIEKVSAVKSEYDEVKGRTLEDISDMVRQLNNRIARKKGALAPIIKELRPLRQRCQELTVVYEDKKAAYDTRLAGLESNRSKLEQEVRSLHEEVSAEESRYHYLNCMMSMIKTQKQKIEDEMKAYTSSDPVEKRKTFRELYSKKIQEQENLGKGLREKQKTVREQHGPNMKQMNMWQDFERLMECKRKCSDEARPGAGKEGLLYGELPQASVQEEDRLVL